jgi:choline kinase
MKAIILAAGKGTRLRPHTDDKPKCMVELAGKPLLHRQLEALRSVGVERIMLVGGYRADRLDANGVELAINPRYAETNMVSTLFCAEDWMTPGEDLLITYGDIVYEPRVVESLINFDAPIAISIDRQWQKLWESRMDYPLSDAETLKLADGNRIVELGKKPNSLDDIDGQYMGLIKVRGDSVQAFCDAWHRLDRSGMYDGKDFDNMYMTSFIQSLIDTGHDVRAAFNDNGWIEVDTVEDLSHYERMQREGTLQNFVRLS